MVFFFPHLGLLLSKGPQVRQLKLRQGNRLQSANLLQAWVPRNRQRKTHLCRDGTLRPWLFLIHHRLNFLFRPPTCTSFLPRQSRSRSWHLYTPELFLSKTSPIFTWQIVQAENRWRKIYQLVKIWSNVGNRRIPPHPSILLVKVYVVSFFLLCNCHSIRGSILLSFF